MYNDDVYIIIFSKITFFWVDVPFHIHFFYSNGEPQFGNAPILYRADDLISKTNCTVWKAARNLYGNTHLHIDIATKSQWEI